jgi:hypothetical protein
MTNTFKQAIEEVSTLPEAAQQKIGADLLLHVDKVRRLRSHLETAAQSLDRGQGRQLHISDITKRARARYGQA